LPAGFGEIAVKYLTRGIDGVTFFLDASDMAASTLTITYIVTPPSTTATATIPIPVTGPNSPIDFTLAMKNIFLNGGTWILNSSGVNQFIPWQEIISATAQ
jgi:hypothetical protein